MPIELPDDVKITKLPAKRSNSVGRPRKYQTPKDMQKAIDEYFDWVEEYNQTMEAIKKPKIRPSLIEMSVFLGFADTSSLHQYRQVSVGFLHVINAAKSRIAAIYTRDVTAVPAYEMHWLKKNYPDEWGNPEGEGDGNINIVGGGGEVTINIQKNYGKISDGEE